jgi:hypothetical protein
MNPLIIYVPDKRQHDAQMPVYEEDGRRLEREWNHIKARCLLERLRYKGYVQRGTLGSFIQWLGDWGRWLFPFIGRGWNGIGPRQ